MIFTSHVFLFWFLSGVLALYYLTPFRLKSLYLTIVSYVFYGWWRLDFVLLMFASTLLDYGCGRAIGAANQALARGGLDPSEVARQERRRKAFLLTSICANLGLLGYFKYWSFGIDSLNALLAHFDLSVGSWGEVVLPVGISFYTFQSLSYSIDVYRKEVQPVRRFVDFCCYISLFPQLVAGPIVRYQTLADELQFRTHTFEKFARGVFLFQIGFAKKILIADHVSVAADAAFGASALTTVDAWLGVLAYTLQIYFDFSGYSDMAIGLGLMFGFSFPINFDSPYKSESITEFWRRWHISLSTWLRDYLYVPLGGNRRGNLRTYFNLMATMVLGGLWHGAAMTFILWGAYQGTWLALERMIGKRPFYSGLPRPLRVLFTFVLAMGGWVLFRAATTEQAGDVFAAMLGFGPESAKPVVWAGMNQAQSVLTSVALALALFAPNSQQLADSGRGWPRLLVALAFVVAVAQTFTTSFSPFLYFQF